MDNRKLKWTLRIVGIAIMLSAFPIIADGPPWQYELYELLLFNVGMIIWLSTKRDKFKTNSIPQGNENLTNN